MYQHIRPPAEGTKIRVNADFSLDVPDNPIIPFIEGDGIGVDITPVMKKVVDAAVSKAYDGKRKISLDGNLRRRKIQPHLRQKCMAAGGNVTGREGICGLDQGPAHHAGGRRYSLD